MTWNYIVAACLGVLVFSVFNGYVVPAVFSGIGLLALIKVSAFKMVDRRKKN
jgi:hypothetical protein